MNDQFVTYEIAKRLKELGFNDNCIGWFTENGLLKIYDYQIKVSSYTKAPLWQQAIDWLRTKHKIDVSYHPEASTNTLCAWWVCRYIAGMTRLVEAFDAENKYQQAREAAITKAMELISK